MEIKNRDELAATISSSLPIWSFFLGSALCAVIGATFLILPDILQQMGIPLEAFKKWTLNFAGFVWIFLCGCYLLIIAPLKELYSLRTMLKDYVRSRDCNLCADKFNEIEQACSGLKAENARLRAIIDGATNVKIEVEHEDDNENKGTKHT